MKDSRIDSCRVCDHNGMVEILPRAKYAHETLARCPHDAYDLLEVKYRAEADRAAAGPRYRQGGIDDTTPTPNVRQR